MLVEACLLSLESKMRQVLSLEPVANFCSAFQTTWSFQCSSFFDEKIGRDMSWQEDMSKQQNSGRPAFCRGNNKTLSWDSRPAWSSFFANTSASKRWNNSCATETNNFKAIVSLELAHFNTRLCFVINGSVSVILKRKLLRTDFSKHTSNRHSYSLSVQSHKWALHIQPTVCHCSLACNLVEAKQTVQFMSTEQHLNQFTKRLSSLWCCTQKPVLDRWNLNQYSILSTQWFGLSRPQPAMGNM